MKRELRFDLTEPTDAQAFANVVKGLNAVGVPFDVRQQGVWATIYVGEGY